MLRTAISRQSIGCPPTTSDCRQTEPSRAQALGQPRAHQQPDYGASYASSTGNRVTRTCRCQLRGCRFARGHRLPPRSARARAEGSRSPSTVAILHLLVLRVTAARWLDHSFAAGTADLSACPADIVMGSPLMGGGARRMIWLSFPACCRAHGLRIITKPLINIFLLFFMPGANRVTWLIFRPTRYLSAP